MSGNPILDKKLEAEATKALAEAEFAREQTRTQSAMTRLAIAQADVQERNRDVEELNFQRLKTNNEFHNTFHFAEPVSEASARMCMASLSTWHRLDPSATFKIVFSSPGGTLVAGMMLFDFIQRMRREGHVVETGALGMAASMAGILLQAGDVRWMGKESYLLIHQMQFHAAGSTGEVEDVVEWIKKATERIATIFAERASQSLTTRSKRDKSVKSQTIAQARKFLQENWIRKDWWLTSDEAYRYGYVDEVR